MNIKIGRFWYSSKENNICIELDPIELECIKDMSEDDGKFAVYDEKDFDSPDEVRKWMNE